MIRLFLIIYLLTLNYAFAKTSIDDSIEKTSNKLESFSKNYSKLNKEMSKTAKAILKQKLEINEQEKHLNKLKKELSLKEKSHNENTIQLKELSKVQSELKKNQEKLEKDLIFTIAKSVSLSVILEEEVSVSEESLIEFEVLKVMLENSKKKVKELNEDFNDNSKNIDLLNTEIGIVEVEISKIDNKRKDLVQTQKENKESLRKLKIAEASYKKELKKLLKKQDLLKKTLAELNIIKIDEIRKAKEDEERRQVLDSEETSDNNLPKVIKHGSSYQVVKTKKYVGNKTIAPFFPYTIGKRYGTYTDPIYGIKVFNESISLVPTTKNAKVRTVFNGKVIYADKTAVLDNIVIVEHNNGLHTIYANLSQIAPNIKKGVKIKKGYTIGRVNDELIFEVTQKSFHINPIRLFQ